MADRKMDSKVYKNRRKFQFFLFGKNPVAEEKIEIDVKHNPDEVGVFRDEDLPPDGLNAVERAIWQAKRKK